MNRPALVLPVYFSQLVISQPNANLSVDSHQNRRRFASSETRTGRRKMAILVCTYTGHPSETMDLAIKKIADQYDGALGDSGWGFDERDVEVEFDAIVHGVDEAMIAAGCVSATWMEPEDGWSRKNDPTYPRHCRDPETRDTYWLAHEKGSI